MKNVFLFFILLTNRYESYLEYHVLYRKIFNMNKYNNSHIIKAYLQFSLIICISSYTLFCHFIPFLSFLLLFIIITINGNCAGKTQLVKWLRLQLIFSVGLKQSTRRDLNKNWSLLKKRRKKAIFYISLQRLQVSLKNKL